jgi:hypothetical protein
LREKKLAALTIRQIHNILAGSLDQAVRWGWRSDNPARWATLPPAHQAEVRPSAPVEVIGRHRVRRPGVRSVRPGCSDLGRVR